MSAGVTLTLAANVSIEMAKFSVLVARKTQVSLRTMSRVRSELLVRSKVHRGTHMMSFGW